MLSVSLLDDVHKENYMKCLMPTLILADDYIFLLVNCSVIIVLIVIHFCLSEIVKQIIIIMIVDYCKETIKTINNNNTINLINNR